LMSWTPTWAKYGCWCPKEQQKWQRLSGIFMICYGVVYSVYSMCFLQTTQRSVFNLIQPTKVGRIQHHRGPTASSRAHCVPVSLTANSWCWSTRRSQSISALSKPGAFGAIPTCKALTQWGPETGLPHQRKTVGIVRDKACVNIPSDQTTVTLHWNSHPLWIDGTGLKRDSKLIIMFEYPRENCHKSGELQGVETPKVWEELQPAGLTPTRSWTEHLWNIRMPHPLVLDNSLAVSGPYGK
jgi:hypothetical protein